MSGEDLIRTIVNQLVCSKTPPNDAEILNKLRCLEDVTKPSQGKP